MIPKFGGDRSSTSRSTWAWGLWDSSRSTTSGRTTVAPPASVTPAMPPLSSTKFGNTKTNSEMMNGLMKAAYAAEGGMNDMETFGRGPGFMDEKAYAKLEGQPITGGRKPVSRWLSGIITPSTRSRPPSMPPTPGQVPAMPRRESQLTELPPPPPNHVMTRNATDSSERDPSEDVWYRQVQA
jgi:hypothetical protein